MRWSTIAAPVYGTSAARDCALIRWSKKEEDHLALLMLASGLIAFKEARTAQPPRDEAQARASNSAPLRARSRAAGKRIRGWPSADEPGNRRASSREGPASSNTEVADRRADTCSAGGDACRGCRPGLFPRRDRLPHQRSARSGLGGDRTRRGRTHRPGDPEGEDARWGTDDPAIARDGAATDKATV